MCQHWFKTGRLLSAVVDKALLILLDDVQVVLVRSGRDPLYDVVHRLVRPENAVCRSFKPFLRLLQCKLCRRGQSGLRYKVREVAGVVVLRRFRAVLWQLLVREEGPLLLQLHLLQLASANFSLQLLVSDLVCMAIRQVCRIQPEPITSESFTILLLTLQNSSGRIT